MKKIIVPFFLICGFTLFSCKDDDNVSEVRKLPKSITSTQSNMIFGYNTKSQLIKVVDKDSESEYSETIFSYDDTGRLTKFVNAFYEPNNVTTETYSISYISNTQLRVADEDNEYVLVNLNDKGQAVSFNTLDGVTRFSYDTRGNLVKIADDFTTITASYDNGKGIFSSVGVANWVLLLNEFDLQFFAVNNPVSITTVESDNGNTYTSSRTFTYPAEHIIAGYPTRMSVNYTENGSTSNEVYSINY